jgi:glycosyltransferase involved in cell wall biosynthesis
MDKLIKIAYLLRPAEGGMKTHVLTLLSGLDRGQFDPVLICPPGSALAEEATGLGMRVIALPMAGALSPAQDVLSALTLRKILRAERPDILHIHSAKAGLIGRLAVMSRRRPLVVLTYHSFICDERVGPLMRQLVIAMERCFRRVTDRIITVSRALKDDLVTQLAVDPESIEVIYNGVDFQLECPKVHTGELRIGTIARLAPQKGVEQFMRAAAYILAAFPQASFIIIGDGPLRAELGAEAKSLGILTAMYFLGNITDITGTMATLDLLVFTPRHEAFGMTIVEALSQDTPVVATRVGGIPEVIVDGTTGLLADVDKPRDIADKAIRLLKDPAYAKQLAANGYDDVRERFSATRMVQATQALYLELLRKRRKVRR